MNEQGIRPIDANALDIEDFWTQYGTEVWQDDLVNWFNEQPTLSLNTLRDAIFEDAVAHGLWEGKILLCDHTGVVTNEVMELLSAVSAVVLAKTKKEKERAKEHFNEELADVVIGCFSLAGKLDIDIDAEIRRKMEINHNRPWKHGKE